MEKSIEQIKKNERILTSLINALCIGLSITTLLAVITLVSSL